MPPNILATGRGGAVTAIGLGVGLSALVILAAGCRHMVRPYPTRRVHQGGGSGAGIVAASRQRRGRARQLTMQHPEPQSARISTRMAKL